MTYISAYSAEYIYLKKPVKVYCHAIEGVLFQGEKVIAVRSSGGWDISGTYNIAHDGKLYHTDIDSIIPAGKLTRKNANIKNNISYIFTGHAENSITAKTLNSAVSDWSDLYYESCSTCHKAYEPSEYPCKRWASIVDSMKVQAGLSPSDERVILRYLQIKSRTSKKR